MINLKPSDITATVQSNVITATATSDLEPDGRRFRLESPDTAHEDVFRQWGVKDIFPVPPEVVAQSGMIVVNTVYRHSYYMLLLHDGWHLAHAAVGVEKWQGIKTQFSCNSIGWTASSGLAAWWERLLAAAVNTTNRAQEALNTAQSNMMTIQTHYANACHEAGKAKS